MTGCAESEEAALLGTGLETEPWALWVGDRAKWQGRDPKEVD